MKNSIIAISLMVAFSPAHAIWQGEALDPATNSHIVKLQNCSGTVIGNKFVLTAGHCGDGAGTTAIDGNNKAVQVTQTHLNPMFDSSVAAVYDVALWKLASPMNSAILSSVEPVQDSMVSVAGWEGGALKKANLKVIGAVDPMFSEDAFKLLYDPNTGTGTGMSRPGDSGGPCFDASGVWGTIQGAGGQGDGSYLQVCQRVTNANTKQWILETVNSWSYPVEAKGEGVLSIKVQSVHANNEVFTPWVEGELKLISNSCPSSVVEPLSVCDVRVQGSGKLYLSNQDVVEVNKQVTPKPTAPAENGGGGGVAGELFLLALGALGLRRRGR